MQHGDPQHTHQGTRYTMSGAIGSSKNNPVLALGDPVEITTHNIPGLKEDEMFAEKIVKYIMLWQYSTLYLLCIIKTVFDLLILFFNMLFLVLDLKGAFLDLIFQFPVHFVLQCGILPELVNDPALCNLLALFQQVDPFTQTNGKGEDLQGDTQLKAVFPKGVFLKCIVYSDSQDQEQIGEQKIPGRLEILPGEDHGRDNGQETGIRWLKQC